MIRDRLPWAHFRSHRGHARSEKEAPIVKPDDLDECVAIRAMTAIFTQSRPITRTDAVARPTILEDSNEFMLKTRTSALFWPSQDAPLRLQQLTQPERTDNAPTCASSCSAARRSAAVPPRPIPAVAAVPSKMMDASPASASPTTLRLQPEL